MTREFREFEQAGWEGAARVYRDHWQQLTGQVIEPLLDAVRAGPGCRLLDVATGPGAVAGAATRRGADVIGVDFAPNMLELARATYPGTAFQVDEAEALSFADESFDAVVTSFGMLHFGRPEQALREAFRVLRPGGRIAFTVWATPDQARGFGIVLDSIREHGRLDAPLPPGPPFFRFSDPAEAIKSLAAAGFVDAQVETISQVWRLADADTFFEAFWGGTARTGPLLRAQSPDALREIRNAITDRLAPYQTGVALTIPMPAILATAQKR